MEPLTLVIGNKNYSSWSLRPWLVLRQFAIPFREVRIPLYQPDSAALLTRWSPSGKVPVLHDGPLAVWDSLAICEYLAERFVTQRLWPEDRAARAVARSISAEMHAGFSALRQAMPMNCRGSFPGQGLVPESVQDIERIVALWADCRTRFGQGGEFLFGRFTIADAMYAPVVLRFHTYAVPLSGTARAYADAILALPAMQAWIAAGREESERLESLETYAPTPAPDHA